MQLPTEKGIEPLDKAISKARSQLKVDTQLLPTSTVFDEKTMKEAKPYQSQSKGDQKPSSHRRSYSVYRPPVKSKELVKDVKGEEG